MRATVGAVERTTWKSNACLSVDTLSKSIDPVQIFMQIIGVVGRLECLSGVVFVCQRTNDVETQLVHSTFNGLSIKKSILSNREGHKLAGVLLGDK